MSIFFKKDIYKWLGLNPQGGPIKNAGSLNLASPLICAIFPAIYILYTAISSKTKHIIILGSKGSGKTTLWNKLQNKILDKEPDPTLEPEKINSFKIHVENRIIKISSTKDVGGGDDWIESTYDDIINTDGIYIFYLVDLLNLNTKEKKEEIRSRLYKIAGIISHKKLKDCGCKVLATNYKKYKETGLEEKYGDPVSYVSKVLHLHNMKKLSKALKLNKYITPVELTDDKYIEEIKKQITLEE